MIRYRSTITAALIGAALISPSLASGQARQDITHRAAVSVGRDYEAHGIGGQVIGCKVLKSHRRAVCRVIWHQYQWLDVVTRDGGCTAHGRQVAPHTYRVVESKTNCYTGPLVAEHVAYSLRLRPAYSGPAIAVMRVAYANDSVHTQSLRF